MREDSGKTNIGFDLDGTIYAWHEAVLTHINTYRDVPFSMEDLWTDFGSLYSKMEQDYFVGLKHLYETRPPSKELMQLLNDLSTKYNLFYITCRKPELERVTRRFFKNYNFPYQENLYFTRDKTIEIRRFNIRVYVEDQLQYAYPLQSFCKVYLVKQPYNTKGQQDFECIQSVLDMRRILL